MHEIEPYYNWRDEYCAEDDERSPFYGRVYSEFYYDKSIYNFLLHPQWDEIGSNTLYLKILFADYDIGYAIIELIGEWNDCITNDSMHLKRNIIDILIDNGIDKFILIGENILNFHFDFDDYYAEWFDDIEDGWIVGINFREHVVEEFQNNNIDQYIGFGNGFDFIDWRVLKPQTFFEKVNQLITKRLNLPNYE